MIKLNPNKEKTMYTEKDFRKDFPQNKMLKKVREKAFFKDLLEYNFINCVILSAYVGVMAALSNFVLPTDYHEYTMKAVKNEQLNQQYIEMHEKYDVDHEDIVGLN